MKSLEAERKAFTQATERVLQVARAVDGARSQLVEELREAVGGVILEAARRMAGQALHADPRLVDAIVDEASRALGREGLVVRVAPQDAEEAFGVEHGRPRHQPGDVSTTGGKGT